MSSEIFLEICEIYYDMKNLSLNFTIIHVAYVGFLLALIPKFFRLKFDSLWGKTKEIKCK